MADYPRTELEFRDWFVDEAACLDDVVRLRWPEGFRCPICGTADHWVTARGLRHCRRRATPTDVGDGGKAVFADTHSPLRVWFKALWHVTSQKGGTSTLGLQRVLGLGSYRTAWTLLHKLRRAMVRPGRERLQGMVEVDVSSIGGPKRQAWARSARQGIGDGRSPTGGQGDRSHPAGARARRFSQEPGGGDHRLG